MKKALKIIVQRRSSGAAPTCPSCGKKLVEVATRLKALESEVRQLRTRCRDLEEEVEHLGGGFVASKIRSHFHREGCRWAAFILRSKNLQEFSSHQEAIDAGYRPCKTCCA